MKVLLFGMVYVLLVFMLFNFASSEFTEIMERAEIGTTPEIGTAPEIADYDRLDEVQKTCSSVIGSAVELNFKLDDNDISNLKNELSFSNGDWEQTGGTSAPIMPFNDLLPVNSSHFGYSLMYNGSFGPRFPYKVVSFRLTDINIKNKSKKTIAINGNLCMAITSNMPLATSCNVGGTEFSMWEGHSQLFVTFQGVYAEMKNNNGGERLLCLLGNSLLPFRQSNTYDPWESVKGSSSSNISPPLLQDDQILLILRFPKTAALDRMGILGEMRSLNPKSNQKYFDKVEITAQLQAQTHNYEFSPGDLIAKACDPYPYIDPSVSGGIELYKGLDFCEVLRKVSTDAAFAVSPHWRCNGTNVFCSKFGPFGFDKKINATNGSFKDTRVLMQNILCLAENKTQNNELTARVFAVFRAFDSPDNLFLENQRSGLGNMTIVAEGRWKSSNGQLCMIGCHKTKGLDKNVCDSRICLYIPLSFSIKQRSILIGSISSLEKSNPPFYPLSLGMLYQSLDYISDGYAYKYPYYQYTKIDAAGTVLEKDEPFSFGTVIKKSLLTFPKLQDSYDYAESLRVLAEDLTLHVSALLDPLPKSRPSRTNVEMEVLSLGPMFGRDWFSNSETADSVIPFHTNASYTEKQLLLNVSTQLKLRVGSYNNFSVFFLEGLYDQHVGKMYLIGCRDVRASWKVLFDNMNYLLSGLDCLIEVIISYPPTTARWLVTPTASVSISSQRTEDDPLFFKPLKLRTLPIMYRQQREDILTQKSFEGMLRILTLTFTIGCILRQLFYMRYLLTDSLPYTSLTMLGSQVIGYALPLVIGVETLSTNSNPQTSDTPYNDLEKSEWNQVVDYIVKLQVLVCFIVTLMLCQKVWLARIKLSAQNSNGPYRVPNEKWVVVITLVIHICGYILALIFHSVKTGQTPIWTQQYVDYNGTPHSLKTWETLFQEYTGLLHDLFLLPQIIGNIIWQIDSKPLLKIYYMGNTVLRLLPHLYDYVKGPAVNPYFSEEYEFVNPRFDFYSEFGDIAIPVLAIVLVGMVYIQQKWNYEKLSNILRIGQFRLLPASSRMYEKLPSDSVESELVCDPIRSSIQKADD